MDQPTLAAWRAGILAADFADWITVAAYCVAALMALGAARAGAGRERLFWSLCAVLMIALGVNEVFDFQTVLTALGKTWARSQGLYEQRRLIQLAFVTALAVAALLASVGTLALTRKTHSSVRLALLGLLFIGAFVLVRAASFHHVDALLGFGPGWFNLGSVQEMAGIVIVAFAAHRYAKRAINAG